MTNDGDQFEKKTTIVLEPYLEFQKFNDLFKNMLKLRCSFAVYQKNPSLKKKKSTHVHLSSVTRIFTAYLLSISSQYNWRWRPLIN